LWTSERIRRSWWKHLLWSTPARDDPELLRVAVLLESDDQVVKDRQHSPPTAANPASGLSQRMENADEGTTKDAARRHRPDT
jgi:hypothetical protein